MNCTVITKAEYKLSKSKKIRRAARRAGLAPWQARGWISMTWYDNMDPRRVCRLIRRLSAA